MVTGHVFIATSLDGFIAKTDGDIEWLIRRDDPREDHGYNEFIQDKDAIVMGRGTFEKALTFPDWYYTRPVLVMSQTLKDTDIPSRLKGKVELVKSPPKSLMDSLNTRGWRKVYVDGGQVIQSFLAENLIADITLTTVPVLLGGGKRLFGALSEEVSLVHVATTAFPSGLVQSKYLVSGK